MIKSYLLSAYCILVTGFVFAQEITREVSGEVEDVQVIIQKDKPLSLPTAARVYQRTVIEQIEEDTTKLSYKISQPKYELAAFDLAFEPKAYEDVYDNAVYPNYIKGGFGNYVSPLLEAVYSYQQDQSEINTRFFYESFAKGPVNGKESGNSDLDFVIKGNTSFNQLKLSPAFQYKRLGFNYYGFDETSVPTTNDYYLDSELESSYQNINGAIAFSFLSDLWKVDITPKISKELFKRNDSGLIYNESTSFGFDADANYFIEEGWKAGAFGQLYSVSNVLSTGNDLNNLVTLIAAQSAYHKDQFEIDVKLGWSGVSQDSVNANLPFIKMAASYDAAPNLSVGLGYSSGVSLVQFEDLVSDNPYIIPDLVLPVQKEQINVGAYVGYDLLQNLNVKLGVKYRKLEDYYFWTNTVDVPGFGWTYSDANWTTLNLSSEYYNGAVSLNSSFTYQVINADAGIDTYLPQFKSRIDANYQFNEKLILGSNISMLSGIDAPSDAAISSFIFDLGFNGTYHILERWDAFATVNNVLSQNYIRYENYPSRGLAAKIGFIFHF